MDFLQTIDIPRILSLSPVIDEYSLGTDFILGELSGTRVRQSRAVLDMLRYPLRFDGYIIFFQRKGHFKLDVNLNTYEVGERTLLVNVPGNIVRLSSFDADAELRFVLVSRAFMSSIPVDFNKVYLDSIRLWNSPCVTLEEADVQLLESYFLLAREILTSPQLQDKREVLGSLLTSVTYVCMDVWTRLLAASRVACAHASVRGNQLFERFIALVTEYHSSERGMAFYADKMCLTERYLGTVVRQTSGVTAKEWIDRAILTRIKVELRHTDKTVTQISEDMCFTNPSFFNKFFKRLTGTTPAHYRGVL